MRLLGMVPLALATLSLSACGRGELRLPHVLSDHMVLQRESEVPLWGWGEPGAIVRVKTDWSADEAQTLVDALGTWRLRIATPAAGGPYSITIRADETITLSDVWIGEVWVASGQSNMEFTVGPQSGNGGCDDFEKEIASAAHPRIREFRVARRPALEAQSDCDGEWIVCGSDTVAGFSAVAYFFARELERELDCPVGVIASTWGGTAAHPWISDTALRGIKSFDAELEHLWNMRRGQEPLDLASVDAKTPSALFNGMIAPLLPFAVRGFLWYQGESNVERSEPYAKVFNTLITDWRWQWARGDLPFLWVQIAPWRYPNDRGQAGALRDAQRRALGPPNNGMACTLDIGDPSDIHPRNKSEVGRRLSLWALAKVYGRKGLEHSGPVFRELVVEGASARLSFGHTGSGLVARGGELSGFEIAGEDRRFVPAQARIDGANVVVTSEEVAKPVAVRYAWAADARASLFSGAGLPAPSFRSDNWPVP